MFKIDSNKLTLGSTLDIEIVLENNPYKVFEFNQYIYVLIEPLPGTRDNNNAFCYNQFGQLVWRINYDIHPEKGCSFVDVYIKDKNLILRNWCGFKIEINPLTGEVLRKETYLK